MSYEYVTTLEGLQALCQTLSKATIITLDTEFVRTRTLNPQLGLLQVFDGETLALIDPVLIDDLSCFCDILTNQSITKVLHSCSEDIDALWSNLGVVPQPLFDTQFAASLLNKGASIGYANLVESLFDVTLDKGESRTDWIARPLSHKQLDYAAADVTYLMAIYDELASELNERRMTEYVTKESECLIAKKTHPFPAEYAYLTISNNWKLGPCSLYALKLLAKWRLETAREKDIAINFVLKEAAMLEIAMKLPQSNNALFKLNSLYPKQVRLYAQEIIQLVTQAVEADESLYVRKPKRLIEFKAYKKAGADIRDIAEQASQSLDIPIAAIASKKQIGQFLKWAWVEEDETTLQGLQPDLITGWRKDVFIDKLRVLFGEGGTYHALRRI
ncbi:ribonuclease D [Glaciecola sp. XM2]|jgi:ribonuclease D|nr:ribonuclease D [Glaciecola sp. XM2]